MYRGRTEARRPGCSPDPTPEVSSPREAPRGPGVTSCHAGSCCVREGSSGVLPSRPGRDLGEQEATAGATKLTGTCLPSPWRRRAAVALCGRWAPGEEETPLTLGSVDDTSHRAVL